MIRTALLCAALLAGPCAAELSSRIAFVSFNNGTSEIYTIAPDGGHRIVLGADQGRQIPLNTFSITIKKAVAGDATGGSLLAYPSGQWDKFTEQ